MHAAIALTYLVAARIEPNPSLRSPLRPRRRRRRTRAALGRLLLAAGGVLQQAGHRLSGAAPPGTAIVPTAP
jgi:hypothetical protein